MRLSSHNFLNDANEPLWVLYVTVTNFLYFCRHLILVLLILTLWQILLLTSNTSALGELSNFL